MGAYVLAGARDGGIWVLFRSFLRIASWLTRGSYATLPNVAHRKEYPTLAGRQEANLTEESVFIGSTPKNIHANSQSEGPRYILGL